MTKNQLHSASPKVTFEALAKTLPVGIYMCDKLGRITFYNDIAVKLWGYAPALNSDSNKFCAFSKVWLPDGTVVTPDHTPMAVAVRTGRAFREVEARVQRSDGSMFYASVNIDPVFDENGALAGAVNVFQDISNQKASELALRDSLRESEEKYHRMISEVQDYAIILLSPQGIIENWNKGAERIKGYAPAEAIGRNFRIFYSDEDQQSRIPEAFLEKARNEGRAAYEGWRVRKDGTLFWGYVVLTAIHDANNNIVGFSKMTRDLTEKKAAEDALRASAERLSETNTELVKMNEELAAFAYVSSHDLQEPLRKIQTFASRILELDESNLSEKSRDYFTRLTGAAYRMRILIDDLLSYSRTNTGERKLETTDLNELFREVQDELKEKIDASGAKIIVSKLPALEVISFQLRQLISNIISNSLKFTRPGVPPVINVSASLVNGAEIASRQSAPHKLYNCICIQDNGIGFAPAFQTKIFEIFQRLHDRNQYEGSGIGLSICKRIAENHGGFIVAEGEVNKRATFKIYIPVKSKNWGR